MSRLPFFTTVCSKCARRHEVEIRRLGKRIRCLRCSAEFVANDADARSAAVDDPMHYWIHFTEAGMAELESSQYPTETSRLPK